MPSQSATTTMQHVLSSSLVCSIHSGLEVDSNSHQSLEKDNSAVSSKTFFKNKILSAYFDWAVLYGQTSALDYVVEKMRTDGGVKHSIGPPPFMWGTEKKEFLRILTNPFSSSSLFLERDFSRLLWSTIGEASFYFLLPFWTFPMKKNRPVTDRASISHML